MIETPERPNNDPVDGMGPDAQDVDTGLDPIEALQAEVEQLKAQSLIERADLENQRKRLAREIEVARRFANERLLADLLPVFDSLEAGLAADTSESALRAGLELTLKQLHSVAERNGLVVVAPQPGDAFNPEHHNAVSQVASAEVAPGTVVQTFQKGYLLNDRLLRPAMVVVAQAD